MAGGQVGRPASSKQPTHHTSQVSSTGQKNADGGRVRGRRRGTPSIKAKAPATLHSPYPWMNYPESIVQDYLTAKRVPFVWHAFIGTAVDFTQLMPGYAPTFTLPDYKVALFVISPHFGSIPGVLDQAALAITLLQVDGWKALPVYDSDIIAGNVARVIENAIPQLANPSVLGAEIPNPYGDVSIIAKKRSNKFQAHGKRGTFRTKRALLGGTHGERRRKPRRGRRLSGDTGERRRASDSTRSRSARPYRGGGG